MPDDDYEIETPAGLRHLADRLTVWTETLPAEMRASSLATIALIRGVAEEMESDNA